MLYRELKDQYCINQLVHLLVMHYDQIIQSRNQSMRWLVDDFSDRQLPQTTGQMTAGCSFQVLAEPVHRQAGRVGPVGPGGGRHSQFYHWGRGTTRGMVFCAHSTPGAHLGRLRPGFWSRSRGIWPEPSLWPGSGSTLNICIIIHENYMELNIIWCLF